LKLTCQTTSKTAPTYLHIPTVIYWEWPGALGGGGFCWGSRRWSCGLRLRLRWMHLARQDLIKLLAKKNSSKPAQPACTLY
jgi:hypothetical protein